MLEVAILSLKAALADEFADEDFSVYEKKDGPAEEEGRTVEDAGPYTTPTEEDGRTVEDAGPYTTPAEDPAE